MAMKLAFEAGPVEQAKFDKFAMEHEGHLSLRGAIGVGFTISVTPTSLGPTWAAKCPCGAVENLTDYDSW
jgi:hypothetical protein